MTKLSFWTKVWYGYGNIGNAVKTVVFSTFLFYYYNQLLGLSGKMCGTALLIALCFDALNDPLIGFWSDKMASKKWGKRLPFMIFGGLPFAISLFFLFIPPSGLSQLGLFIWFIFFAVFTRTAQTFFQIPYLSLGAELTDNYAERSELYGFVQFFGFVGNVSVSGAGFLFFFHSTATYQNGMLNAAMYPWFGLYAATLIILGSYGSIIGTRKAVLERTNTTIPILHENFYSILKNIFKNKSFKTIIIGLSILMIVNATGEILSTYLFIHFWGFKPEDIAFYLAVPFFVGLTIALWLSPKTVKWFDKKYTLIYSNLAVWVISTFLILIQIFHLIPNTETARIITLMVGIGVLNIFAPLILITVNSIFADIADEVEYESESQKTGTLFSVRALLSKIATGVGGFFAGFLLDVIDFPKNAEMGKVAESVILKLGIVSGPLLAIIGLIPIFFFLKYTIDKKRFGEIREAINERKK
jgi:glycoside/pentoside/hexuronide:cation symporter, GPH family